MTTREARRTAGGRTIRGNVKSVEPLGGPTGKAQVRPRERPCVIFG